jgi:hypothetical protein
MHYKLLHTPHTSTRDLDIHFQVFSSFCQEDVKSEHLSRHPREVATLAKDIAQAIGLNQYEQEIVYIAALNHDLGKFLTPDDLILSEMKLNPIEFLIIKSHPLLSCFLGSGLSLFESPLYFADRQTSISKIIRYHHEKYNGTGYERKKGDEIPLASCIIMMADSFCAATEDKKARGYNNQATLLESVLSRFAQEQEQFNPRVYRAFQEVIQRYREQRLTTREAIKAYLYHTSYQCTTLPLLLPPADICSFMDRLVQRQRQFLIPHNGTIYTIHEKVEPYIIAQSGAKSVITIERADGSLAAELTQVKQQLDIPELVAAGFNYNDFLLARRILRYVGDYEKAEFTCLGYSEQEFETLLAETNIADTLKNILRRAWIERKPGFILHTQNHTPEEEIIIKCSGYLPKMNIRGTALDKAYSISRQFLTEYGYTPATIDYIIHSLRLCFFIEYIALLDENYYAEKKDLKKNSEIARKKLHDFVAAFPFFAPYERTILHYYDKTPVTEIDELFFVMNEYFSSNGNLLSTIDQYSRFLGTRQFKNWLLRHPKNVNPKILEILRKKAVTSIHSR